MTVEVPTRGPKLLREMFEAINREQMTITEVSARSGVAHQTITRWRAGTKIFLDSFEAVLNTMGYELVILPIAKPFNED